MGSDGKLPVGMMEMVTGKVTGLVSTVMLQRHETVDVEITDQIRDLEAKGYVAVEVRKPKPVRRPAPKRRGGQRATRATKVDGEGSRGEDVPDVPLVDGEPLVPVEDGPDE